MPRFILSPLAQLDIEGIWDYTVEHWDLDQAERYIRDIQIAIEKLAQDPLSGRPCDNIRASYYRCTVGSHVLFYQVVDIGIDVKRILHIRRDFQQHL